jgi:DNA-binding SARP family transcriptional activator/tetratricopeptide (TPR) repeat protein
LLEFRTLGRLDLRREAEPGLEAADPSALLSQPKPTALFAYLVLSQTRGLQRRDHLAAMFWPESDDRRARAALSQILYVLRQSLGSSILEARGSEEVGIAPDAVWCDAVEFRRGVAEERFDDAMELYQGELLPAFFASEAPGFERWLEEERADLARLAADASWKLAVIREAQGNAAAAGHLGRRAVSLEPYDEAGVQRLLELLGRLGDRSGAIREFDQYRQRVVADLGLEPSEDTRALVERIRASGSPPVRPAGSAPERGSESGAEVTVDHAVAPDRAPRPHPLGWVSLAALGGLAAFVLLTLGSRSTGRAVAAASSEGEAGMQVAVLSFGAPGTQDSARLLRADQMGVQFNDALVEAGVVTPPYGLVSLPWDSAAQASWTDRGVRRLVHGDLAEDGALHLRVVDPVASRIVYTRRFPPNGRPLADFVVGVAQEAADTLGVMLGLTTRRIRVPRLTDDPIADSLYQYGQYLWENHYTAPTSRRAAAAFAAAIERDPDFIPAYIGLVRARHLLSRVFWETPPREVMPELDSIARFALALDPSYPHTHRLLGWIAYTWHWDFEAAEAHYEEALRLAPDNPRAIRGPNWLLLATGRLDEVLENLNRAEPSASSPIDGAGTCWLLTQARQFERAIDVCERFVREVNPNHPVVNFTLGNVRIWAAEGEERARLARELVSSSSHLLARLGNEGGFAMYYAMGGDTARALAQLDREKRLPKVRPFRIATGYAWSGELDSAFVWLNRAVDERDPYMPELEMRPAMEPFRDDPRYDEVLARIGIRRLY